MGGSCRARVGRGQTPLPRPPWNKQGTGGSREGSATHPGTNRQQEGRSTQPGTNKQTNKQTHKQTDVASQPFPFPNAPRDRNIPLGTPIALIYMFVRRFCMCIRHCNEGFSIVVFIHEFIWTVDNTDKCENNFAELIDHKPEYEKHSIINQFLPP